MYVFETVLLREVSFRNAVALDICTVLLSPDGLFSDRATRCNSAAYITHRRGVLGGEAGF